VRRDSASTYGNAGVLRLRKYWFAVRLVECFLFVSVATIFARSAALANHLIWVTNGVLLAFLLLEPRKRWAAYLGTGFVAQMAGCLLASTQWQYNLLLTVLNLIEVLISALLMHGRTRQFPRFTNRVYLIRFMAFGVLAGPLAVGLLNAVLLALWLHTSPEAQLLQWTSADALGAAVSTPACVAILRAHFRETLGSKINWVYLLLLAAFTLAVFSQTRAPVAFLLYPLLLLVLLRMGLGWAAMATLFVAAVGCWGTVRGEGPFASYTSLTPLEPSIVLQVFIASGMFMLYSISVVLESQRATERRLRGIVSLHTLITENSRDAIIFADLKGNRRYVSSAIENLGGWRPEALMRQGSFDLIHPADRPKVEKTVKDLGSKRESATMEMRVRKSSGEYIWVESRLRVAREPQTGAPYGILNTVRDITERKKAEKQLQDAYHAVEALAITDGLTGLANRRRFDQCLTTEWRRGMRDRTPLSLLLIDADWFKSYNDTYGHLRGDSCLKQIAEAAQDVVMRSGDLVARFGGEEYAIILPNTLNDGALRVANDICKAMRGRKLPHKDNPNGIMTISVGCATITPQLGHNASSLIDLADEALYKAKRNGRNRVCSNQKLDSSGNKPMKGVLQNAITRKLA
jgi:diguanylate cyclase (GGDEF)-like protein/PAS domain S-box-containing protein